MRLIVNGYLGDKFKMEGGGKQGDPLFPYIFLIVMMGLISLIEMDENIVGVSIPTLKYKLKILQFADDTTTFLGAEHDFEYMIQNMVR